VSDPVAFGTARLDEDEATAKRAAECERLRLLGAERGLPPGDWSWLADYGQPQPADIALIDYQARIDPARVLREVAAKRTILADHAPQVRGSRKSCSRCSYGNLLGASWPCLTVAQLVAVWSDHPDYGQGWKP
jgi:Family of unknown function (DUF6221)